jgi:hypothetical protein
MGMIDEEPKPLSEIHDPEHLADAPTGFVHGFYPFVHADSGMAYETYLEIRQWCKDHFGIEGNWPGHQCAWEENRSGIWIRNPTHAMEFKLRWL